MSYQIEKKDGSFCIVKDDGSVYKEFETRREAVKELGVLMAYDPEEKKEKKTGGDDEEAEAGSR